MPRLSGIRACKSSSPVSPFPLSQKSVDIGNRRDLKEVCSDLKIENKEKRLNKHVFYVYLMYNDLLK